MSKLINDAEASEIKRWLEWSAFNCVEPHVECKSCKYKEVCNTYVKVDLYKEALALIEHLETKLNERNSLLAVLGVTVPDKEKEK